MDVGFAVSEIKGLNIGHGGKHPDNSFVGIDISHRMLGVGRVGMDAELAIYEAFDTSLKAVLEAVFAGSCLIIYSTSGEVASSIDESVHLRMNDEVVFHGAFAHGHFGFIGTLREAIIAERDHALVSIYDCATHFG